MPSLIAKAAALALAALPIVNSQTFTECDPTKRPDCPINKGLNQNDYFIDFTQGGDAAAADWKTTSGNVIYGPDGAEFKIAAYGDGPTLASNFYIFFGRVEVELKAAPGRGIVSSFVLQSEDLDEIDWEWIGSDDQRAQSNYFGKGNTTTYDRGQFHNVADTTGTFHKYAVEWTETTTVWFVDDVPIRTLNFAEAVGGTNYPQTPMSVRLGDWIAGQEGNSPGTIEWAGGLAEMSKAPFSMFVKSVKIANFNPAEGYKYGDMTGSYQSIQKVAYNDNSTISASSTFPSATQSSVYGGGSGAGTASYSSISPYGTDMSGQDYGSSSDGGDTPCPDDAEASTGSGVYSGVDSDVNIPPYTISMAPGPEPTGDFVVEGSTSPAGSANEDDSESFSASGFNLGTSEPTAPAPAPLATDIAGSNDSGNVGAATPVTPTTLATTPVGAGVESTTFPLSGGNDTAADASGTGPVLFEGGAERLRGVRGVGAVLLGAVVVLAVRL